jgi:hypothetical protein
LTTDRRRPPLMADGRLWLTVGGWLSNHYESEENYA